METNQPFYVEENRRHWNDQAPGWVAAGERSWATDAPTWGQWGLPESELQLLPVDMSGMAAIELGCGTGYVSAWMARRGASVVGIDVSENQLATARRLAEEHGLHVEYIQGNAEQVPKPDGSFDFAISEYGAALWADPHRWVPEAARLVRPGGSLVFLTNHPFLKVCFPLDGSDAVESLERPYFGMHMFDWTQVPIEPGGVDFNLTISDWFALLRGHGFLVERFLELQAPDDSDFAPFAVSAHWAHRYPSEMVVGARRG